MQISPNTFITLILVNTENQVALDFIRASLSEFLGEDKFKIDTDLDFPGFRLFILNKLGTSGDPILDSEEFGRQVLLALRRISLVVNQIHTFTP